MQFVTADFTKTSQASTRFVMNVSVTITLLKSKPTKQTAISVEQNQWK
jgi:hypothetical protein